MKLYELKYGTYFRVVDDAITPPDGIETEAGEILKFIKIDGMYSICKNAGGDTVHLAAYADVDVVGMEYLGEVNLVEAAA